MDCSGVRLLSFHQRAFTLPCLWTEFFFQIFFRIISASTKPLSIKKAALQVVRERMMMPACCFMKKMVQIMSTSTEESLWIALNKRWFTCTIFPLRSRSKTASAFGDILCALIARGLCSQATEVFDLFKHDEAESPWINVEFRVGGQVGDGHIILI